MSLLLALQGGGGPTIASAAGLSIGQSGAFGVSQAPATSTGIAAGSAFVMGTPTGVAQQGGLANGQSAAEGYPTAPTGAGGTAVGHSTPSGAPRTEAPGHALSVSHSIANGVVNEVALAAGISAAIGTSDVLGAVQALSAGTGASSTGADGIANAAAQGLVEGLSTAAADALGAVAGLQGAQGLSTSEAQSGGEAAGEQSAAGISLSLSTVSGAAIAPNPPPPRPRQHGTMAMGGAPKRRKKSTQRELLLDRIDAIETRIKNALKRAALKLHPDVLRGLQPAERAARESVLKEMTEIHNAVKAWADLIRENPTATATETEMSWWDSFVTKNAVVAPGKTKTRSRPRLAGVEEQQAETAQPQQVIYVVPTPQRPGWVLLIGVVGATVATSMLVWLWMRALED